MDTSKIQAIVERKSPKNMKQIKEFLGAKNYYRVFIKDYAKICEPLYALLRKDVKFIWETEQEKAFNNFKEILISEPILRQPDFRKKFFLHTDASGYAMGAILSQTDVKW